MRPSGATNTKQAPAIREFSGRSFRGRIMGVGWYLGGGKVTVRAAQPHGASQVTAQHGPGKAKILQPRPRDSIGN